jgi:hypothetical protein
VIAHGLLSPDPPENKSTSDDSKKYQKYWEDKKAPEQSEPYSTYRKYEENGDIKQVTTYDKYGNRHRQYDFNDPRHGGDHQHDFKYKKRPQRPKAERSKPKKIDEK